ncbi:MAG: spore maturation protein [Rhodospirillales bacterium RIFCSPLOWO2_12_FULL_58_28]|nr:MAG: spore maturation protein [Rhodospirillales bacterium RIFCSPLOWO2_02_FULL_58_16]OHC79933.1 MAG: spore maturation protein [Rhodospirillales bacterium RIFCSPLOWO2_12_FULL_58_28]
MNGIFFAIVLISFAVAGFHQITWIDPGNGAKAPMELLTVAMIDSAAASVTLAIGMIGVMALFLGLMKVAEAGGLLVIIARAMRPLMQRLFPDVPADHPAMGAMILNLSANIMGLGNAATPFGIRAMQELDKLNPVKGVASNAMVLFLAINTSSVTIVPTGVIALRAAAGSNDPAGIIPTTLFATIFSTAVAIIVAKACQRYWPMGAPPSAAEPQTAPPIVSPDIGGADAAYPTWASFALLGAVVALIPLTIAYGHQIAPWIIPGLMVGFLGFGAARKVQVYEAFVEGAKDGFEVALRIIPYLVAILVAVGMFRAGGAMDMLVTPLSVITTPLGLPAEALTMALMRTLSGSGAYGLLASIVNDPAIGPDSYLGYLAGTIQGSTETTFYVLAVYFGAVNVRRIRHALAAGLCADLAGVIGSMAICLYLYG